MTVIKLILLLYLLLGQNIEFVCHFFIAREYKGSPSMSLEFSLEWKILIMELSYLVELKPDSELNYLFITLIEHFLEGITIAKFVNY